MQPRKLEAARFLAYHYRPVATFDAVVVYFVDGEGFVVNHERFDHWMCFAFAN